MTNADATKKRNDRYPVQCTQCGGSGRLDDDSACDNCFGLGLVVDGSDEVPHWRGVVRWAAEHKAYHVTVDVPVFSGKHKSISFMCDDKVAAARITAALSIASNSQVGLVLSHEGGHKGYTVMPAEWMALRERYSEWTNMMYNSLFNE